MLLNSRYLIFIMGFFVLSISVAHANQVTVSVASNFTAPMKEIARVFKSDTGHKITLVFASSGKLFAQINHGAPYDIFLSADQKKPLILSEKGMTVPNSQFTYAIGNLVLWSSKQNAMPLTQNILVKNQFNKLAIANAKLAPYGFAAVEVLKNIKLYDSVKNKLVQGENISQTYQFVLSKNADIGFVALSQVITKDQKLNQKNYWRVPNMLYSPIKQDAVLLHRGKNNQAAIALLQYLKKEKTKKIIESYGYSTTIE